MNIRIAVLGLLCSVMSFAQIGSLGSKGPSVTAAPIAPVTVARGGSASFEIDFRVAPGFHINSNQPKGEYLLPTALKLDPPSDVVIAKISYPPGQDYSFSFAPDEKLNVYSGDFKIRGTVKTTSTVPAGTYRVHGTLNYQACDNTACYPPKKLAVAFDIHVQKTAARAHRRNPGQSPNSK